VKRRLTTRIVALFATVLMSIGPIQPAAAADLSAAEQEALTERAERVQERMASRITQDQREAAAARQKLMVRLAALRNGGDATGLSAMAMPMPGDAPDYFGMTPNWAYSPPMRKFVDGLPGVGPENKNNLGQYLSVAYPDTTTYPGCDYYEIELREYTEQMHSDMPPTTLRGYVQTNFGTDSEGNNTIKPDPIHYLGPTVFATKDRPVRVKFTNKLPTGEGGDLFIPVDTSYMGAGMGPDGGMYTENRASVHLHGGKTVWISDGTPHQWITPAGEDTTYPAGVSVENVPDMPDPGDGSYTFFYSNQQSARMLWYHDHAYGITRLTVYTGQASGYFITDDTEQELVDDGILPEEQVPLIIQDKTFTDADTIMTTDPLWEWGSQPGTATTGDLWFPHVYMPAQNPAMPDGVAPMGRWHYGPWFWPPTVDIMYPPVPNPYYDPVNAPWQNEYMPGTPYDSSGMEAFMDTPLVNGTPYPVLEVDPKSYRFRILNAASDRFWNLQLYEADPDVVTDDGRRNTEVKMVEAAPTEGWPADWPVDGREGGVPDPETSGPDWIQVGTEGGFLPKPAVFPNQPVTWVTDVTLFNAGLVDKHTMLLGPAERADVVLDFSDYAGKTLILYNDAPAAFPAGDPRYDYYTGAPDMTDTGGTAGTEAGYGPNTRTIMQIKVADTAPAEPYDLAALEDAFASDGAEEGVFEKSQNPILVPNSRYDSAYDETFPEDQEVRIYQTEHTFTTLDGTEVTFPLQPKAIQDEQGETFDEYGRMRGNLGLERPSGVPGIPNFILYGYMDPATEELQGVEYGMEALSPVLGDGTQIWKITHNGVDTHPMHFHLYDVQLINRVAWDGFMYFPDDNELGWKDTVRVSPLEDTIVALRPVPPSAPFNVPDSERPLDPTMPLGSTMGFSNFDPTTGLPYITPVENEIRNFAWEYVWHCHILSHEEMDMMRPVTVEVPSVIPTAPVLASPTLVPPGASALEWIDATPEDSPLIWGDISNEIGFRIERASVDASGVAGSFGPVGSAIANATTFDDPTISLGNTYVYRVVAYNEAGEMASNEMTVGPIADDTDPVTTSNIGSDWHQSIFDVSLEATDTLSGVAATYYTLDGGPAQPYAGSFPVSGETTHAVTFWSEDTSGNVEAVNSEVVKVDDTDPATESNIDSDYHQGPFEVLLDASDALSGVKDSYYTIDGGPMKVYDHGFNVIGEGDHTVQFWSVDNAGNAETLHSATVRIDDTAPVTTSNTDAAWDQGPFSMTLGATDALSGVASAHYSLNGGPTQTYTGAVSVTAEGTNTVEFWSVDEAGNVETRHNAVVKIDNTPPTTVDNHKALYTGAASITLVPADPLSGVASTSYILDGGPVMSGTTVATTQLGTHTLSYWSTDAVGNVESAHVVQFSVVPAGTTVQNLFGPDRVATAIAVSQANFAADSVETVVLASSAAWPDALVGSSLAGVYGSPILLTRPAAVPSGVVNELARLGASEVVILGGTGAVSPDVEAALEGLLGAANVRRIGGVDRYATARLVAAETVAELGGAYDGTAFVATGRAFPDALGAGPLAAANGWPIYLVGPTELGAANAAAMDAAGVTEALVLGGTGAISSAIADEVQVVTGTAITRLAGDNRYATAAAVAEYGVSSAGLSWDNSALAQGQMFPDALSAAAAQGKVGSVLLLTPASDLHPAAATALNMHRNDIHTFRFIGGEGALSANVRLQVISILN